MVEGLVEMSSVGMSWWVATDEARWMSSSDQQRILDGVMFDWLRRVRSCRLREVGLERRGVRWIEGGRPSSAAVFLVVASPMV